MKGTINYLHFSSLQKQENLFKLNLIFIFLLRKRKPKAMYSLFK